GLATLRLVDFPSKAVEPLIAASIVYVGIENLVRRGALRGRSLQTFAFGLVHGFGFAAALQERGVSSAVGGIALPLISFNFGVELGQICIALLALPLIWRARNALVFARRGFMVCSLLIVAIGSWWLLKRTVL